MFLSNSERGNVNTHDWGVSTSGRGSSSTVTSSSELNLQCLPIEIIALDIQRELGVLPGHHVQQTVLLDVDGSSDCSRRCSGGVGQKLSIDLQEVSKIDETLGHHIISGNSLLCGVVEQRGWLVGGIGWVG